MRLPLAIAVALIARGAMFGAVDATVREPEKIDFNRDVRPILSENCFYCHGQDPAHREAKLRLDDRENATRQRDGYAVIVPGNADGSELIQRIISKDEE